MGKTIQDYTMVIRPDSNGTFVAYVPATSSAMSSTIGATRRSVRQEAPTGAVARTDGPEVATVVWHRREYLEIR